MSSAQQNFSQGQAHGQTQAKAEEWVQSTKDSASAAAQHAKAGAGHVADRAHSATQHAQAHAGQAAGHASDRAHSATQHAADRAHSGPGQHAQAATGQAADQAHSAAGHAAQHAHAAANTTGQTAERNKEEAAGFLQQTGEQVKNMAHGAVETVKHTLGMDKK